MRGYAKILKDLRASPLWVKEPIGAFQAYLDLCFMADDQLPVRLGRIIKDAEPGVVWTSERYLEVRWGHGWDRNRVRRFLTWLDEYELATVARLEEGTRIELHYLHIGKSDPLSEPPNDPLNEPATDPLNEPKGKTNTKTQTKTKTRDLSTAKSSTKAAPADAVWFAHDPEVEPVVWVRPAKLATLNAEYGEREVREMCLSMALWAAESPSNRKADWGATCHNWLRRDAQRAQKATHQTNHQTTHKKSNHEQNLEMCAQLSFFEGSEQ